MKISIKSIETAVRNNSATELLKLFKGDRKKAHDAVVSLKPEKLATRAYDLAWGSINRFKFNPYYVLPKQLHSARVRSILFAKRQIADGSINTSYGKILIEGNRNIYWASPEYGHSDYNKSIAFENNEANRKLAGTINSLLHKHIN